MSTLIEKVKGMNKIFTKEEIILLFKLMKKCLTEWVIKDIQTEITMT